MKQLLCSLAFVTLIAGCSGNSVTDPGPGVPADHTVKRGSAFHRPGLSQPLSTSSGCSASACHQADLRGGEVTFEGTVTQAPSCYSCHGQKWSQ